MIEASDASGFLVQGDMADVELPLEKWQLAFDTQAPRVLRLCPDVRDVYASRRADYRAV